MALNLDQLAARWILGLMSGSEIANAATQALAEGYDGPGLRVVAGTVDPDLSVVNAEFERALDELKAPRPSRKVRMCPGDPWGRRGASAKSRRAPTRGTTKQPVTRRP